MLCEFGALHGVVRCRCRCCLIVEVAGGARQCHVPLSPCRPVVSRTTSLLCCMCDAHGIHRVVQPGATVCPVGTAVTHQVEEEGGPLNLAIIQAAHRPLPTTPLTLVNPTRQPIRQHQPLHHLGPLAWDQGHHQAMR